MNFNIGDLLAVENSKISEDKIFGFYCQDEWIDGEMFYNIRLAGYDMSILSKPSTARLATKEEKEMCLAEYILRKI